MKKAIALLLIAVMLLCVAPVAFAADPPVYLLGDVDDSGRIEPGDARLALRASVGLEPYKTGSAAFTAADVNRDGKIGSDDARTILRAAVGLERLPTGTEMDYLCNGRYYLRGTMTDSYGQTCPLEMAVTPDSVYMLSDFEGTAMGILIKGKTTCMLYPDKKACLVLSDTIMKAMGMSASDLIDTGSLDYSMYDLNKADEVFTEEVNGTACRAYVFNNDNGSNRFYLNGGRLVRFGVYDAEGRLDTVNDIDLITDQVPADKTDVPSDYKKYRGLVGLFAFMRLLEDVIPE